MKRNRKLDQQVCKLYKQGMTANEIKDEVGVCVRTVLRVLNDNGIPRHERVNRTQEIVLKNRKHIERELDRGIAPTTIALSLMLSPSNFALELNRLGIRPLNHTGSIYDSHYSDISRMRKEGYSLPQIADAIDGNASGVSGYCVRMCIPCGE